MGLQQPSSVPPGAAGKKGRGAVGEHEPTETASHDAVPAPDVPAESPADAPDESSLDAVAAVDPEPGVVPPLTSAAATGSYPNVEVADGRRRRRVALAVLLAAVLAGGAGMWIGSRIESPADRAAARQAPTPSLVTVPVERRRLTSEIVLSGEVAYNEPLSVALAGAVGLEPGETAVVTEVREAGSEIHEGEMLIEVTTRPVFVLQGELPMYRRLAVGTEGPDVAQLEAALERLGYDVGGADTVFDAATGAAVEQMYADKGYTAEGPSEEQRTEILTAREAVIAAERALAEARTALDEAQQPLPESQRLQLEQAVDEARAAVPAAQAAAADARVEQEQMVATARAARDTAQTVRDAANVTRDAATAPGAIDPDTGEPYSPERIAALGVAAAEAQQAYTEAEAQLVIAEQTRTSTINAADAAIDTAVAQRRIAEAQFSEGVATGDDAPLRESVTTAETALATAQAELGELEAASGTRISPGEVVFAPVLPANLTESYVALGSTIEGPVGMLATSATLIRARVARADAASIPVGSEVGIDIRDAGVSLSGTVLSVGEPQQQPGAVDDAGGVPGGSGESGRMEAVIEPGPEVDIANYMFYGARVRVPVDATDGEVLVVPVAALTVGPDEVSQVEVERVAATDDTPAETEIVAVTVGLSAGGLAEVAPIEADALGEGDRVVIGVDTHLLPGNDEDESGDEASAPDDGDGGSDGDGSDGDGGDDGEENDDDDAAASSPLAELMGWVSDPVEQRRQELEIEEQVAECMKAEGWEYTPVDWSAQMPDNGVDTSDPEAFGEKYGYGVMYNYETYELGNDASGLGGPTFEDPNSEYVMSLSPADQEAYNADLYGDPGIWDEASVVDASAPDGTAVMVSPGLDQQGCQGQARLEVVGEDLTSDPEVQQMMNEFYQSQENDPGLQPLLDTWIDCFQPTVDEYGIEFELANIFDGYQMMDTEKYKALGAEVVPISSQAEMDEYYNSGANVLTASFDMSGKGYVVLGPEGEMPELTGEQIDELTEMEIELWKVDWACRQESGYDEYQRQQEQALVDELVGQFPELGD